MRGSPVGGEASHGRLYNSIIQTSMGEPTLRVVSTCPTTRVRHRDTLSTAVVSLVSIICIKFDVYCK